MTMRERVLAHLASLKPSESVTRSRLAQELGLTPRERRALAPTLGHLLDQGLISVSRGRYKAAAVPKEISGLYHASRFGYGFVTRDGANEADKDIFIPPHATAGALDGDRVMVRKLADVPGGKGPEGEVAAILERSKRPVAGIVQGGFLYPFGFDRTPIALPRNTGGEGKVAVALVSLSDGPPSAESADVLGDFGDPSVPVKAAEARFNLTKEFPKKVMAEAEELPEKPSSSDIRGRTDFRELAAITIDPDDAKDFDDALSIRREGANFRLFVHIADVSHYVKPGGAMDHEALRRGNSTYLPGTAYPMLPERLSSGLCSLVPGEERLTFTAEIVVDAKARARSVRFAKGVIRSRARLTYKEAQAILDGAPTHGEEISSALHHLNELAELLGREREKRGSLDLDLPEATLRFGLSGRVEEIMPSERLASHRLVEECMLLCNTAVAEALDKAQAPCLYRVHEPPDPKRLEPLRPLLCALGLGEASRGDLGDPFTLQKVLAKAKGHRAEKLVAYLILRGMMQARYSAKNAGHYGLALSTYCHFTSPIRRYPDLVVHRSLAALLGFGRPPGAMLEEVAAQCSATERQSDEAEREVERWHQMAFLSTRLGDLFEAIVLGFGRAGIRVELLDHLVEGLCPFHLIDDDRIRVDRDGLCARGIYSGAKLGVGEAISVRLVRVDVTALEAHFVPESWPGAVRRRKRARG
ncbi:MAG: VacB/RNase II family 3'-5' exoribonuclease [Acidobacteria bacterium]|nr:VacB/RNase II family 3'-5' exoribonuclease [Acidobacteriota bacterium]